MSVNDSEIPQWKKDLIARLRNQNKRTANVVIERQQQQQQLYPPQNTTSMVVESSSSSSSSSSTVQQVNRCESVVVSPSSKHKSDVISYNFNNNNIKNKMVQESLLCNWDDHHQYYKNGDDYHYNDDSEKNSLIDDNFDDLHYGPGIVNKLKNKYLSLILRESNNITTILPMRKAASLENILDDCGGDNNHDDDDDDKQIQQQQSNNTNNLYNKKLDNNEINKNQTNRYRKMTRGNDKINVKRARSVETISRHNNIEIIKQNQQQINEQQKRNKRESMPEEMLINFNNNNREGNGMDNKQSSSSSYPSNPPRINRPKRLQPVVNEKEKPPVDFVKQTKLIFERHRPELYKKKSILTTTTPTTNGGGGGGGGSEVAAKVQTYKNIIVKNKPPIKQKPTMLKLKTTRNHNDDGIIIKTPPDISQLEITKNGLSSDTPDLIITSSPVSPISPNHLKTTTATFIKEEIRNHFNNANDRIALKLSPIRHDNNVEEKEQIVVDQEKTTQEDGENDDNSSSSNNNSFKQIPPQTMLNIDKASTTITYNFAKSNRNVLIDETPINQPLKLDTTTISTPTSPKIIEKINKLVSPPLKSSSSSSASIKPALTMLEIEKNLINTVKTLEQPKIIVNNNNNNNNSSENVLQKVPKLVKKSPPKRESETNSNSIVFKFTDRKDVPDYLHDDGAIRVAKIERPKVGEGGIILLPGASIEESFTEDDDDDDDEAEIMRSLEAPPSPCDVTFINDNILIDGKSSLITTQKATKRNNNSKLKISFVEEGPDIYEYPSESSFVIDDTVVKQQQHQQQQQSPSPQQQQMGGRTVPSLSGSSLANYTPKGTEEFQPGVTRVTIKTEEKSNDSSSSSSNETILQEIEKPITFSAGTNSDILF